MSDIDDLGKKYEKGSKAKDIRSLAEQLRTHDGLPARKNADGSYSTELSITVTDPRLNRGRPTNIPSLWGGKEVDEDAAVSNVLKSNKKYRSFASIAEAEAAAKARSNAGGASADAEIPFNPDTKRAFESRKETVESLIRAAKQAAAGFKGQWSGLDDEGKVGMGKGTPGIYYDTAALPAILGEKYAPDFAVAADKKSGQIKEAVRKDMNINEPKGALEQFSYAGGQMLGQIPVPGAWMKKIVDVPKKLGIVGKVAAAPIEYLSPTIDPRAINYGIGTAFGGTMGSLGESLGEPESKALGGLVQKYEGGGKVGKVKSFFSAVDQAIDTMKQKKGTGEQILKQLEATPGVKQEELEARGIKQKLQSSPKITQEELQKTAKRNRPAIPKRIVLGGGVDPAWQPKLEKHLVEALNELDLQPVVDPATGKNFGIYSSETGDILSRDEFRALSPDELGLPVNPESGKLDDPESRRIYMNARQAVDEATQQFTNALDKTQTKFESHSLSKGKDNYREVLLQHEDAGPSNAPALNARLDELLNSKPETEADAQAVNEEINRLIDKLSTRRPYHGSHFSDPDIFAHYRVSDMTGPNGEKVLYVDEVQSDWHQQARDARKAQIKNALISEKASIDKQALEQLRGEIGNVVLTPDTMTRLKKIELALTKERKAQLEKEVPENAGYRTAEDNEKLDQINEKMQRLRDTGLTTEEIKEYYTPGRIIGDNSGYDKVLAFNDGSKNPRYQEVYDRRFQQAMNSGVGPDVAANFARRRADEDLKHDWSVTVVQVDPRTGEPLNGYGPRTHQTSPESEIRRQLQNEAQTIETKKPDAPFKKNWHELAVRDILDLAAKEGYDKVAFSPGIAQVRRYTEAVRNVVDEIQFAPTADGQVVVTGIKGGSEVFNGTVLGDTFVTGPQKAIGRTLEEVFGGKIGKQIEEQSQVPGAGVGKISGEDLTIGGEGMKSFYDQRLPSYVKEYGKKEFKAPTGYMEIKQPVRGKSWTPQEFRDEMDRINNDDSLELMEMVQDMSFTRAEEALTSRGRTQSLLGDDYEDELWDEIENQRDSLYDEALRTLAQRNMEAKAGKQNQLRAFSIDVTPEMKEKINTQGQRLHGFVAPPVLPPMAAGAAGAEYIRQSAQQPAAESQQPPQEQPQEPPEEPQGFQKGGKVGNMREAAESLLRVLHGSPTKVLLDKEKNLDVTTDPSYAMKRARDKMEMVGQSGPPMLNKFDVPAAKMLRFEETYSPADVALMRRFYNKLPEGQAMTGEEIYDAAGGKDYVMEGIAKAGNMAGYERPAGGSGGIGNWFRVTDQEALTRKARGGFVEGYADGGIKGGKVDLARRGILGLSRLFEEPAQTANLPAVIPTTPLAKNPIAKAPEVTAKPEVAAPLTQLIQKAAETPMSRRDVLKRAGQVAIQQVVPMPKIADVIPEIAAPMAPLTQMAADIAQSTFKPNPTIDEYINKYVTEMAEQAWLQEPGATSQSMWISSRNYLKDILSEKLVKKIDRLAKTPNGAYVRGSSGEISDDRAEILYDEMLTQMRKLKPHEQLNVVENMYQMNGDPVDTAKDITSVLENSEYEDLDIIKQEDLEKYLSDMYDHAYKKAQGGLIQGYADGGIKGGKVDLARRGILGLSRLFEEPAKTANLPAVIPATPVAKVPEATSPLSQLVQKTAETPMSRRDVLKKAGNVAISQAAKGVIPMAAKEVIKESLVPQVSHLDNIQDTLKSFSSESLFDVFHEGGVGERLFAPGYGAYESFLPFISKSLSPSDKAAIEKAQKLFNKYDEELDGEWYDADTELPKGVYDKILEGVDILQNAVLKNTENIPLLDWPMPEGMEKLHIDELKDYGHELTPKQIEDLKNTEWGQDFFYGFDGDD